MLPWIFSRKGASGFSWASTADQVTAGISASGLTAIVTAASARVLAARGAHVVMASRNLSAAETVRQAVLSECPSAAVDLMELDLSSLASVRKFAADFAARGLPLNILINNAGVMATPFSLSKDGIEMQFATNHVGHFLLTHLLLETMKKTSRESNVEGRIVNVSSEGHRFAYKEGIRFAKLNDEEEYSTIAAYGQSKLANILHANELARRFKEEGVNITANSLHPGSIITNLLRHHSIIDGVMATPFSFSKDGIEMQFATNHVGHFLLTHLLLETMKKTSRESNVEGRIVNVSSEGHRFAYKEGIRFAKLNDEEEYSTIAAYGQSKLANILHANELARRFKEEGINMSVNSLHPGSIITNLLRHHSIIDVLHRTLGKLVLKNAKQGAATQCYLALHPGKYWSDSNLYEASEKAKDAELGKKLWDYTLDLVA